MKKRQNFSIYLLIIIGALLVFASSCKKDDDDSKNNANTFTDARDGNVYKTVTIGTQVWMAENLKYLPSVVDCSMESETTPYYYVYAYNGTNVADAKATVNYNTYGVLYNWAAAKAACPVGWHLPSDAEWTQLTDYLGGVFVAERKLKEIGTIHWQKPNDESTNESGFTALPGGHRFSDPLRFTDGAFLRIGSAGDFWSATEINADRAWLWGVDYDNSAGVSRVDIPKKFGYSVRCVKD